MKPILRPSGIAALAPHLPWSLLQRCYATQNGLGTTPSSPRKKTVTPFNDDGQVLWHQLSAGEKTARATQQSFNFGMILVGMVLTGGVSYLLYTDVFSPDSKTAYFNRAVDKIKKDPDCLKLLGDAKHIEAHGEPTQNKWRRARPIASTHKTDSQGTEHLMLHFYVHGPLNTGTVNVHLVKRAGHSEFEYKYLFLDVPGQSRIYLENADTKSTSSDKKYRLFGITQISSELKAGSADRYGLIFLWALICHFASFLMDTIAHMFLGMPDWTTVALMFNNTTSYPLLLIDALQKTDLLKTLIGGSETTKEAIERAKP